MTEQIDPYRSSGLPLTPAERRHGGDPDPELVADAKRWRYVRDNLTQAMSLHMDATAVFHFRSPHERGKSVEEVIDQRIEAAEQFERRLKQAADWKRNVLGTFPPKRSQ